MYPKRKWLDPELVLKTPDEKLRACGLSRSKTAALKDLAAKTLDGTVPTRRALLRMTDEEIIQRLTSVRDVGESWPIFIWHSKSRLLAPSGAIASVVSGVLNQAEV